MNSCLPLDLRTALMINFVLVSSQALNASITSKSNVPLIAALERLLVRLHLLINGHLMQFRT